MKKVLVIAYYFPPHGTVGALRPLGFCCYLREYGWMPQVVSTDAVSVHPRCRSDEGLSNALPKDVVIHRVPYANRLLSLVRFRDRLRRTLRLNAQGSADYRGEDNANQLKRKTFRGFSVYSNVKRFVLGWAFDFPDPQNRWFKAVMRQAASFASEQKPDLIFATGSPWTGLLVGRALANYFRIPFVADFRDPWITDPAYGFSFTLMDRKAERLEATVCHSAAAIIANTEELRLEFLRRYPSLSHKFVTITNGFNRAVAPIQESRTDENLRKDSDVVELCHFGNVYGDRSAYAVFRAVSELYWESRLSPARFRLRFVGSWEIQHPETLELAKQLEDAGLLRREPLIPHDECMRQMASATALLILQPHSATRIPAKTYEYIAARRPIILIGEEGAASHLIERHRLGRWCQNAVPAIKTLFAEIVERENMIKPPAVKDIAPFEYRVLTKQLGAVFDKVMSGEPVTGLSSPKTEYSRFQ